MKAYTKNVRVGVAVLIFQQNKLLLGERIGSSHGAHTWQLPGGHLEFGETWEECAIRETKEETGINIYDVSFVQVANNIMSEENKHYVTIFMSSNKIKGKVKTMEPKKCKRWEWFCWNTLPTPLFSPLSDLIDSKYKQNVSY